MQGCAEVFVRKDLLRGPIRIEDVNADGREKAVAEGPVGIRVRRHKRRKMEGVVVIVHEIPAVSDLNPDAVCALLEHLRHIELHVLNRLAVVCPARVQNVVADLLPVQIEIELSQAAHPRDGLLHRFPYIKTPPRIERTVCPVRNPLAESFHPVIPLYITLGHSISPLVTWNNYIITQSANASHAVTAVVLYIAVPAVYHRRMITQQLQHPFGALYDEHAQVLILGSFPSVKSREQMFFYGHPQNRFWRVMRALDDPELMTAGLSGAPIGPPATIEEKKALILRNRIALWDTIAGCTISGSSDSSIRDVSVNDLSPILTDCSIRAICCNGTASYNLFMKYAYPQLQSHWPGGLIPEILKLPSTSPANAAWTLPRLLTAWSCLLSYTGTR